jgi:acyl-CoA thioesterase-1
MSTSLQKSLCLALTLSAGMMLVSCAVRSGDENHRARPAAPIRVACVGDSITYGYGISGRESNSYPARLQSLLGAGWEVRNFGYNGATALKQGTKPYTTLAIYSEALAFQPDVVIIKLGTNDTNPKSWPQHHAEFYSDYLDLVRGFLALPSRPKIVLCRPVPLFRDRGKDYDTDKILREEVIPVIDRIAREQHLKTIDLYAPFASRKDLFPDGVHPNAEGASIIAGQIASQLQPSSLSSKLKRL